MDDNGTCAAEAPNGTLTFLTLLGLLSVLTVCEVPSLLLNVLIGALALVKVTAGTGSVWFLHYC